MNQKQQQQQRLMKIRFLANHSATLILLAISSHVPQLKGSIVCLVPSSQRRRSFKARRREDWERKKKHRRRWSGRSPSSLCASLITHPSPNNFLPEPSLYSRPFASL
jgi:hypothetical protein